MNQASVFAGTVWTFTFNISARVVFENGRPMLNGQPYYSTVNCDEPDGDEESSKPEAGRKIYAALKAKADSEGVLELKLLEGICDSPRDRRIFFYGEPVQVLLDHDVDPVLGTGLRIEFDREGPNTFCISPMHYDLLAASFRIKL